MTDYYTTGEREFLLKIARLSLERFLITSEKYEPQTLNKKLWERRGVFVTLNESGQLRGCMGNVEPMESLIIAVRDNIILAALDSRFDPVEIAELKKIKIEISILSELEPIKIAEIKMGDGVVIKNGDKSTTYLPQVWKKLKNKNEFLISLAEKAGLAEEALASSETEFFIYRVVNFSE